MRGWAIPFAAILASCFYDVPPLAESPSDGGPDSTPVMMIDGAPCSCVPAIPMGWVLAAFGDDTTASCPSGFVGQTDWITNPTATSASTCSCTCTSAPMTQPTCTGNATFNITFGTNAFCSNGSSASLTSGSSCVADNASFMSINQPLSYAKATSNLVPSGGSCAPPTIVQTIPPASSSKARSCVGSGLTGACGAGVCAPIVAPPFHTCIVQSGDVACPAGWSTKTVAGDGIADTRSCGPSPCACAIGGTCTATLHLYTTTSCNFQTQIVSFAANGQCVSAQTGQSSFAVAGSRYNGTSVSATCSGPQQFAPTGTLGVTSPATFCCL